MHTLALIGFFVLGALLTLVKSMQPRRASVSRFELERRAKDGAAAAKDELARELLTDDVLSLKHAIEVLLLVCTVLVSLAAFGPLLGIIASFVAALAYGRLSQTEHIHALAQKVYEQLEAPVITFAQKNPRVGQIIRSVSSDSRDTAPASKQEFEHLVANSASVLNLHERQIIMNSLHFNEKTVEQIMTPRGVIEHVQKDDMIGPLLLDQLHKTGHSRFPVIDGDIDHVVGVLHIRSLVGLEVKESKTAGELMEKKVFYVNQDQNLQHALAAFLHTHHHLFVVVNGYRETCGIITLEDVMEALLGYRIMDEFDNHEDLRAVAQRQSKSNNNTPHGKNV